jgi:hypothetical protein
MPTQFARRATSSFGSHSAARVSDLRQGETRRWVLNGGPLAGSRVCSPRSGLLVSNPSPITSNNRITTDREKEGLMAQPTHRDAAMPEDHDEIKSDEIAALEREVDGLRTALGTRTLIGKALGIIIEREGVNETEAFEMLKNMSQHRNVKMRDLAARMVEDARPPGLKEP